MKMFSRLSPFFLCLILPFRGDGDEFFGEDPKEISKGPPAAPSAPAPKSDASFPWQSGREYRLSWILKRKKVGETRFKISEENDGKGDPSKKIYRSSGSYWYRNEGISTEGTHESFLDSAFRPIRFKWHHEMSGPLNRPSRQDQDGEVRSGRLTYTVVHNGDAKSMVRQEFEVPGDAFLLLNQSMDCWAILASRLAGTPASFAAKAIYPDFLKTYEIQFTFEKEETLDMGKPEKPVARRYSFRSREGQLAGKLWLNGKGQMILYQQDDLKIFLED